MLLRMFKSARLILAFAGVFGMGIAFGWMLPQGNVPTTLEKFFNKTTNPNEMAQACLAKYVTKYNLTEEEQLRIRPILNDMTQHLYDLRHSFSSDVLATEDHYHQLIAEQLDPDQRALYLASYKESRGRIETALSVKQQAATPAATPAPLRP